MHDRQSCGQRQRVDARRIGDHEWVEADIECVCATPKWLDRGCEILARPDPAPYDVETECARCCLRCVQLRVDLLVRSIEQDCEVTESRDYFAQQA